MATDCRRCSECIGEEHHFSDVIRDDNGDFECKHCDVVAEACNACCEHPVWPPHESGFCEGCRDHCEPRELREASRDLERLRDVLKAGWEDDPEPGGESNG
jgi:hypothetical protein